VSSGQLLKKARGASLEGRCAMKPPKLYDTYRPFKDLKALLEENSFPLAPRGKGTPTSGRFEQCESNSGDEERLFQEAMADVVPASRRDASIGMTKPPPAKIPDEDPEAEALTRLEKLVRDGEGFTVSDTPEYMEGIGYGVNPEVARRLHRGDYSIQAHIDLHGLGVGPAHEAFEQFLKEALSSGKRAVLLVHGRGLSSREEPVLKTKVTEWLTSGRWRKWVMAFTSARACDGATGATYVLLRQSPATKRYRRQRPKKHGG
jgi:DNA-nicking Smr family endonuclease